MRAKNTILTREEQDIILLAAKSGPHLGNTQIAQRLGMSASRVKMLMHQACTTLRVYNRAEAVVSALKQREISTEEIYSLNELIQYLATLGADSVEKMAQTLDQKLGQ